jgi:hypothetical protein
LHRDTGYREEKLIERISIVDKDTQAQMLRPALEFTLFSTAARADTVEGYLAFYRRFFERYGKTLRWYRTNTMKQCRKLPVLGPDPFIQVLTDRKAASSGLLGIEQHSGTTPGDFALPSVEFFSEEDLSDPQDPVQRSFMRVCWPVEEVARSDEIVEFVTSVLVGVPVHSGYCGYSYYWDTGNIPAQRRLVQVNREWLLRYPGLNYGDPVTFLGVADLGIPGVSWLTVLGATLADRTGGPDLLRRTLPEQVKIIPAGSSGIVIQAGEKPGLGDVNLGNVLPLYKKVGTVLSPLRIPDEWIAELPIEGLQGRENLAWYLRFLGESP